MNKKYINPKKGIFFRISGLPGSGKTRIALKLLSKIKKKYGPTIMWSGDDLRRIFKNRKYDLSSRNEFGKMNVKLAAFILNQKTNVIFATVGLNEKIRQFTKKNIGNYIEICIKSKISILRKKKVRRFYKNKNNIKNVWGYDIKPQYPKKPDIEISNNFQSSIEFLAKKIFNQLNKIL